LSHLYASLIVQQLLAEAVAGSRNSSEWNELRTRWSRSAMMQYFKTKDFMCSYGMTMVVGLVHWTGAVHQPDTARDQTLSTIFYDRSLSIPYDHIQYNNATAALS
jgi:hypothetical protein